LERWRRRPQKAATLADILAIENGNTPWARTRYLWLHPADFVAGTGTPALGTTGAWATLVPSWSFPGGGTVDGIATLISLPSDWGGGTVRFTAYYQGAGANTGNRRIEVDASAVTPLVDSINVAVEATLPATVGHGNGVATFATPAGGLTVAAGDLVRVAFARDSSHADDTNTDAMNFFGIRLEYTAFL